MTAAHITLLLVAAALGLSLTALFSGMETGLYTLNRVRLTLRRAEGDASAIRLTALLERPARMLATVLLGTNIASAICSTSLATLLEHTGLSQGWVVVTNTAILVPLVLVLGEILPKDLFRVHGDRWCYTLSGPMAATRSVLTWIGVVGLVEWVGRTAADIAGGDLQRTPNTARQRMSDLLKEGTDAGVLSAEQAGLLDRALNIRTRRVFDEMIPWANVRTIDADATRDARIAAIDSNWTRLPVVDNDGRVQSAVSVIDMGLSPASPIETLQKDVKRLDAEVSVAQALVLLRQGPSVLGIVERDGLPIGLITAKDLVETLTGELAAW
jgi:CBS domain containing-hemolysin-like protein